MAILLRIAATLSFITIARRSGQAKTVTEPFNYSY